MATLNEIDMFILD